MRRTAILLMLSLLSTMSVAWGQFYNISTIAGNGRIDLEGVGGPAVTAKLVSPRYVTTDAAGNVYFTESYFHQVLRVGQDGVLRVFAGNSTSGFSGDGGQATEARLNNPGGLAVDGAGNVYIADTGNNRIRRVTPGGVISTVAGNGTGGVGGNDGPALSAALGGVVGLAFDNAGNLYFSQSGAHRVRVMRTNGNIEAVAGTGTGEFSGDNGQATAAGLFSPAGLAVDAQGNLYIADTQNQRIRKVTPGGVISTVAGTGGTQFNGDNITATQASLQQPSDVKVDSVGNLYIPDTGHGRLRTVGTGGIITSLAGGGGSYADGVASTAALPIITGVALDEQGNVVVTVNAVRQVRRVSIAGQTIQTIAGVLPSGTSINNQPATATPLLSPQGLVVDQQGNVYVADTVDHRVQKVTPQGTTSIYAGSGIVGVDAAPGTATAARVGSPTGLALLPNNDLVISMGSGASVQKVNSQGAISTIVIGTSNTTLGDGGPAGSARLTSAEGVAADAAGNIFVTDRLDSRIRRIDAGNGTISTYAGNGTAAYSGDNGPAAAAQLSLPRQVAFDSKGNTYIADTANHRVRKVTPGGIISTVAGTGTAGTTGDNGPAVEARLNSPTGIAVDPKDNLFIATANTIRKVDAATGVITRIAGTGTAGFSGDGGWATNAQLSAPFLLASDKDGNIYTTDANNKRVRKLTAVQIIPEGVVNGATQLGGGIAPGEIISIYGFEIGPATPANLRVEPNGKVATELGGTQVFFDGKAAPLIYASSGLVNLVVPYSVSGTTQIQVVYNGKATNTITMPVVATSPGFFAITNQDVSLNTPSNRADRGSVLIFYGTGEGQTNPPGVDGAVALTEFPKPVASVSVKIGGQDADVLYVGAAPFFVSGVLQMNVRIPASVTGTVPLEVKFGDASLPAGTNVHVK